ncbi:hypothetical protein GQ457_02G020660 [Hibiscus cannabinus]
MGHEQCKMVTTRSRTKANNEAIQVEENGQLSNEENESPEIATTIPRAIFPEDAIESSLTATSSSHNAKPDERLRKQKYEYQFRKFLDILKQVHINLPLVEAIEQMSNYAKFLKDIVSKRTRLNCEADEHAPIILGRPFLATGRMLIYCEKEELTIRVNDQKVTLNIFKSLKQLDDPEECQAISAVTQFNFEVEDVDLDKILAEASKSDEVELEDDEPKKGKLDH